MTMACWVDEGKPLDAPKLLRHGITAPYFSHRDPTVTADMLDRVVDDGMRPGIYSAWNWYPNLDGPGYAAMLSSELKRIGWKGNAPVCVDIETHDVAYILAFFKEWRQVRPTRPTAWTMEGFQGGLFNGPAVAAILASNVRLVPQFYRGDMSPVEHSPIIDMLMQGFPGDRIDGFYNATALPYRWRGFAFTQATLS